MEEKTTKKDAQFICKIEDWHGLHGGYTLRLRPGYTALVGSNGAGKTTLLSQLKEIAKDRGFNVLSYSNLRDGGGNSMQKSLSEGDLEFLATAVSSSEGEQVYMNFGRAVKSIGKAVAQYKKDNTPLLVLLDAIDSGASIDRQREIRELMSCIERDIGVLGNANPQVEIYIVAAVNTYELAAAAPCVDVRDEKQYSFTSYSEYADFICRFFDRHPRMELPPSGKPSLRRAHVGNPGTE